MCDEPLANLFCFRTGDEETISAPLVSHHPDEGAPLLFPVGDQDRWLRRERVGEGTYGVVYRGVDRLTGKVVAIKKIRVDREEDGVPSKVLREVAALRMLRHPRVICLHHLLLTQHRLELIFECADMDLRNYREAVTRRTPVRCGSNSVILELGDLQLRQFLADILSGLVYLHENRVIHRDIKLQNLLVMLPEEPGGLARVKLGDFGLGRVITLPVQSLTPTVVTLWYKAPELLLGAPIYEHALDIWSVGCIMGELCGGNPLFPGTCELSQLYKIFQLLGTPTEETWPGVTRLPWFQNAFPKWKRQDFHESLPLTPCGLDLLDCMLCYSPSRRISAREALQHPFFTECDKIIIDAPSQQPVHFGVPFHS